MSLSPSFLSCQTKSIMFPWVSRRVIAFVRCPLLSLANPVFIRIWKNGQQPMPTNATYENKQDNAAERKSYKDLLFSHSSLSSLSYREAYARCPDVYYIIWQFCTVYQDMVEYSCDLECSCLSWYGVCT